MGDGRHVHLVWPVCYAQSPGVRIPVEGQNGSYLLGTKWREQGGTPGTCPVKKRLFSLQNVLVHFAGVCTDE